mgnify:FL=1
MNYRFEVYENDGGALTLAVLTDAGDPVALFENWEYDPNPGNLREALRDLEQDPTAWECWDGDMVERIATDWPYRGEAEPPTVESLYAKIAAQDDPIRLANGELTDPERWGYAARKAMGITPLDPYDLEEADA